MRRPDAIPPSASIGFNPRTHEGCDCSRICTLFSTLCFNPRTHEGCDCRADESFAEFLKVSIHAPTKGATCIYTHGVYAAKFQSTHPRRVRHDFHEVVRYLVEVSIHAPTKGATKKIYIILWAQKFQSTHPRRVRLPRALRWRQG